MTETMTSPSVKRLYRSRTDRKVAGVLGGLGGYLNVDPTLLRVLFLVAAVITGGAALLAYPVMWMITPETPSIPTGPTPSVPVQPSD
jgi:phage shock protein C